MTIGLKGHVLGPAFPEGYSNWQKTDLHDLIDAELIKEPTDKNVVKAIKKVAKEADELVIATDFDREGELIGLEALEEMLDANPDARLPRGHRRRQPGDPARPLLGADQGRDRARLRRARHALLPARQRRRRPPGHRPALGRDPDPRRLPRQPPLRLQLPLGRPRPEPDPGPDRRARDGAPRPRRQTVLGAVRQVRAPRRAPSRPTTRVDKFWEKAEADAALRRHLGPGHRSKSVTARKNTRKPPTPYNTTAFSTDASSRLGITPASAMRIAEDLYMDGFISYPRTDNTVYPASLPLRELVSSLVRVKEFSAAAGLLDGELKADPRQKRDHRPPADLPDPGDPPRRPRGPEETGLRTGRAPLPRHLQPADDHRVDPRRHRGRLGDLLRPRLGRRRPRLRRHLHLRPLRRRGDPGPAGGPDSCDLDGEPWIVDKETQPPSRISQAKLIEMMEERGLGTKATRADIIQKLFDRGYVYGNPPVPSETGIALYEAFKNYVPAMATPEMTAQLEAEMDRIAAGEMTKGAVVGESRDLLHKTWTEIDGSREDLAKVIWKGMDEDRILGPCKVCEEAGRKKEDGSPHMLRIIRAKKSGKRFVGCSGWTLDDPELLRPDLPAAPARRRLQARRPLLDLRPDAAAQSRPLPRPPLEPLPQRRLRVDAGDEETPGRARSRQSGERGDGEEAAGRKATRTRPPKAKKRKSKRRKRTPRRAGANAPKPRPKAEAAGVVHLARGSRRLGQEHPGAAAGRGAGRGDGGDPRAGGDRGGGADPRAARRPGAARWSRWPSCCSSSPPAPTSPSG